MFRINVCLQIFIFICLAEQDDPHPPIVNTTSGLISGKFGFNNTICEFLSIPYAKPPIDDLRWSPPQEYEGWNDTLNATQQPWGCPQDCDAGGINNLCPLYTKEDCLILNVFAPATLMLHSQSQSQPKTNPTLYPVMIYIHGGSFIENYGGLYCTVYIPFFLKLDFIKQ